MRFGMVYISLSTRLGYLVGIVDVSGARDNLEGLSQ